MLESRKGSKWKISESKTNILCSASNGLRLLNWTCLLSCSTIFEMTTLDMIMLERAIFLIALIFLQMGK